MLTSAMNAQVREAVVIGLRRKNISQTEAAKQLETSRQYISRVLRGRADGSVKLWNDLCDIAGVELRGVLKGSSHGVSDPKADYEARDG